MTLLIQSLLITLLAMYLITSTLATDSVDDAIAQNPLVQRLRSPAQLRELRALRQDVRNRGCNVNVCFAIQGDDSISPIEFFDQVSFLDLIANILTTDDNGGLCAIQYGRLTEPISPLTDNRTLFVERLDSLVQVGGGNTNLAAALGYAGFQLLPRSEDANKIVLFADGFETVGGAPITVANRIRQSGIQICAVGVGEFSIPNLQDIAGDPNHVLTIGGFFELLEIVNALVFDICGF